MKYPWINAGLLLTAFAGALASADEFPTPADLPSTIEARKILAQDPHVMAAQARRGIATTESQQLRSSHYQWSVRLAGQQRRYESGASSTGGRSDEWNAELQRPFRLPGKASVDRRIGEAGLAEAEAGIGEATHEAARSLASLWLDWTGANARLQLMQQQEKLAQEDLDALTKRLKAGDAARMDKGIAVAAKATARRAVIEAETDVAETRARLETHFPGIDLQTPPALAAPVLLEGDLAQWQERIQQHSDPIRMARARVEKAKQEADRASSDKLPDPTLGVYTAAEAFGNERIIGLSISMPLPGRYRSLAAQKAAQSVALEEQALENENRELMAAINASHAVAQGRYHAWQAAEEAAVEIRSSADTMAQAYALGETGLQSLLLARRQRVDAEVALLDARLNALRANYLLLIDGHYLWDLAHEE
ncbi:MAG: TolC family protein [Candidatus Tectimicrobiota bacterium]